MQAGKHPYFDPAEFSGRIARLRGRMRETGVDIALFDEIEAMTWLSGYGNSENRWRCVGVPLEGEPFFLIRALDASPCRQRTWITDVPTFRDWDDPLPVLAAALAKRGLQSAKIGLDFGSYCMPLARFARLREALPAAQFVDVGNVVWELRLTKSPAELALLRRAAAIADQAMVRAAAACVRGAAQRDAARVAAAAFIELGADPSHPGPISAGRGWDFLHGHLEDRPLIEGDVVHIELTPRVSGYSARVMRCAVVGAPSKELENAAAQLPTLQDRQIAAMQPGAHRPRCGRHPARRFARVRPAGFVRPHQRLYAGLLFPGGTADQRLHPDFSSRRQWRLEPQMVFHMYASAQALRSARPCS